MLIQICYAALASFGFAVIFHIRGIKMLLTSGIGATGWAVFLIIFRLSGSKMMALFCSSFVIAICAEVYSLLSKKHSTGIIICAIIPLVPGSGIFYTMQESIHRNLDTALSLGIETLFNAGAIAAGIAINSSVKKLYLLDRGNNTNN